VILIGQGMLFLPEHMTLRSYNEFCTDTRKNVQSERDINKYDVQNRRFSSTTIGLKSFMTVMFALGVIKHSVMGFDLQFL
jgi:hypothetical protein